MGSNLHCASCDSLENSVYLTCLNGYLFDSGKDKDSNGWTHLSYSRLKHSGLLTPMSSLLRLR